MTARSTSVARARPRDKGRRGLVLVAAVVVGGLGAFGISQIDEIGPLRELTLPLRHDDIIRQQARDKGLDPALIAAVIYAESRFRDQTSHAGARGLMQITPETAEVIERESGGTSFVVEDLADPDINIAYGSFYLAYLLEKYGGNEIAALAAYNAGETRVDKWGGAELDVDGIGFDETRAYVDQVLDKRGEYRDHYADDLGL